jgi:hypothetical protein
MVCFNRGPDIADFRYIRTGGKELRASGNYHDPDFIIPVDS